MGWGYGTNADGREIGYNVAATCDHPECDVKINRGISFVCGESDHGEDERSCAGYYCMKHCYNHDCEMEPVYAWIVSGPGREYDATWFAFGDPQAAVDAISCAEEWLTESWDQMTPDDGCPTKISVSIEIRQVTADKLREALENQD